MRCWCEWEDAHSYQGDWNDLTPSSDEVALASCLSVGYVLGITKKSLILCPHVIEHVTLDKRRQWPGLVFPWERSSASKS